MSLAFSNAIDWAVQVGSALDIIEAIEALLHPHNDGVIESLMFNVNKTSAKH